MPPKANASKSKKRKAGASAKVDGAGKVNKRHMPGKKSAHLPPAVIPVVDHNSLPITNKASPQLDSLMSVELVQTAIAAIFYDIIWLRKAFPAHSWQNRIYDPDSPNNSYEAYLEGDTFVPTTYGLHQWHVPTRGEDARVDKLMCTLESCAKEPIEKHWLKKLQLCFHFADGNDLSEANLIESYSLTFEHYKDRVSPHLSTSGRNAPADEHPSTLVEGRQTLRAMVDKLFNALYHFDRHGNRFKTHPLPGKFCMIFLAEYNELAPRGYQPPYFKPGNIATSVILNLCGGYEKYAMDTGFQRISAGFLLPGPEDPRSQNSDVLDASEFLVDPRASLPPSNLSRSLHDHPIQEDPKLCSQTSTVLEGSQRQTIGQLQTVGLSRGLFSATQDTQVRPILSASSDSQHLPMAPPYTQEILNHLQTRLLEISNASSSDDLDEPQIVGDSRGVAVKCGCGCQEANEQHMIFCVECQHLQHSECYGYLDQARPANHLCYTCLENLYPEEKPQLEIAASLCVHRFTLYFLRAQQNAVSYEALAKYFGRSLESTTSIMKHLGTSGLVQTAKRHRGYTAQYVGDDEILLREFFRPQKHINSLFANMQISESNSALGQENRKARNKVNTPNRVEDGQLPAEDPSQRQEVDDDTTQGEPSPPPVDTRLPSVNEAHHLRSIAQHGLNFDQSSIVTPSPKRRANFDSPEAMKRMRMSQTSPLFL